MKTIQSEIRIRIRVFDEKLRENFNTKKLGYNCLQCIVVCRLKVFLSYEWKLNPTYFVSYCEINKLIYCR